MKKLFVILTVCVLALMMTVSAANGGFVSSPSSNLAPEILDFWADAEECTAKIVLTPYNQRDTLDAETRKTLEDAYATIATNPDLTKLTTDLIAKAEALDIPASALAVSDLFDLSAVGCDSDEHAMHAAFHVKVKAATAKNFVALMQYIDGEWHVVGNATHVNEELSFSFDRFSPFAIVVNSYGESEPPTTGDAYAIGTCAAVMVVSAIAFVVVYKKSKKAEEE